MNLREALRRSCPRGVVTPNLVLGPDCALKIACSREYRDYIMHDNFGYMQPGSASAKCGLNVYMYGYKVCINEAQPYGTMDIERDGELVAVDLENWA